MGRLRFLFLLQRIPKRHHLYSSPLCHQSFLIRSLTCSQESFKKQILTEKPYRFPLKPCFCYHRSIHSNVEQTQVLIDVDNQNPEISTCKITEDSEKICGILSKNPNSSIDTLLDNVSIEVSPALVLEVLKKLSNAGFLALSFFKWAEKQKGCMYSTESYNALIESLGKIRQFKMIWNLVSDMKRKGLLSKETFTLISRRYARARKVKEAVDTFEKMEMFGLKIESSDFNRLFDTLSKSRQVQSAQDMFDKMKKRRFEPDIKSYTILLEGWGQERNLLKLDEVYREMKGSVKRLSEALEFFSRSKAKGFAPEAPTYNAVVGAYCWLMRMDDAYRIVDEMRRYGIGPNARTYDIILHHLIKAQRTEEALSVFEKMSSEQGCEPTVSTYEIIVRMFCNAERVDKAIQIWDQMKAKGILPGMHMFCTIINSLCHENKLDMACKYFQEMLDVGIRPPATLFSNLKQALLDNGKKHIVVLLAQKIDKLRKTPFVS
ncbi:hypothetical protein JCGZ_04675 [Jatropha curcas]|uniref:Uncharacterized protein n=1 Tax=Jatropha curcas TaxID=180498 RepID=A0A067KPG2_JATCU|nr:hypothetical protein JCGZ_04675 [Jatropha curcas]